jgi:hypothetical protein
LRTGNDRGNSRSSASRRMTRFCGGWAGVENKQLQEPQQVLRCAKDDKVLRGCGFEFG